MTEPTYSWLYGPTPPQECASCGTPVLPGRANMDIHVRYWCERATKSQEIVRVTPDMESFRVNLAWS